MVETPACQVDNSNQSVLNPPGAGQATFSPAPKPKDRRVSPNLLHHLPTNERGLFRLGYP